MQEGALADTTEYTSEQEAADAAAKIWIKHKGAGAVLRQGIPDLRQVDTPPNCKLQTQHVCLACHLPCMA